MAMKHYDGPLLPQVPHHEPVPTLTAATSIPAPPVPPPTTQGTLLAEVASSVSSSSSEEWTVAVAKDGIDVFGTGETIEAAFAVARDHWQTQWEDRLVPAVLPLMWADGTPIEGLERQVLIEALEEYEAVEVGDALKLSPALQQMVAKFRRALGAEE